MGKLFSSILLKYKSILNRITRSDVHVADVLKASSLSLIVKVFGMLGAFGVSLILGRELGVSGYGTIELANRVATFVFIFGVFGLPDIILKEIAISSAKNDWVNIKNCIYTSTRFSGILVLIIISIIILFAPFISLKVFNEESLIFPLRVITIAAFFLSLSKTYTAGINGLGKIWQSSFGDQTLSMILVLLIVFVIQLFVPLDIYNVSFAYLTARIGVVLVMKSYWSSLIPKEFGFDREKMRVFKKELLKPASKLLVSSTSSMVSASASTIFLGAMSTVKEVGLYNISSRLALLTIVFLQITNSALAPKIASFYHNREGRQLQKILTRVTSVLSFLSVITFLVVYFEGVSILKLWGEGFADAYYYLVIIMIGQMVNISTGAVNTVLVMTNNEKILSQISFAFMLLTLILNPILIYLYNGLGACIATAIIIAGENITRLIFVRKKTGINMIPFINSR